MKHRSLNRMCNGALNGALCWDNNVWHAACELFCWCAYTCRLAIDYQCINFDHQVKLIFKISKWTSIWLFWWSTLIIKPVFWVNHVLTKSNQNFSNPEHNREIFNKIRDIFVNFSWINKSIDRGYLNYINCINFGSWDYTHRICWQVEVYFFENFRDFTLLLCHYQK